MVIDCKFRNAFAIFYMTGFLFFCLKKTLSLIVTGIYVYTVSTYVGIHPQCHNNARAHYIITIPIPLNTGIKNKNNDSSYQECSSSYLDSTLRLLIIRNN